jgi:trimeric autotransporter adhesin
MRSPSTCFAVSAVLAIIVTSGCDDSTGPDTSRDVASVAVTPDARTFTAINDSARLAAEAKNPAGGTISGITFAWSSLETNIASVDQTGMVKAKAIGTARIVATASGKSDTATITVTQTAARVMLTPAADTINAIGDVVTLTAVVTDANDVPLTNPTITWSTTTPTIVAAVGGNVTSLATGSAVVIATAGAVADTAAVLSRQIAATLTVAPTSVTVLQGETQSLTAAAADSNGVALPASAITWTSAAQGIATVSAAGVVRGESAGGTTITVSAPGRSIDIPVTVNPGAASAPLTWSVVHEGLSVNAGDEPLGVSGHSASDVYVVTPNGKGFRYDGSRWIESLGSLQVPSSRLRSFWVSPSSSSIWGVGTQSRPNPSGPPPTILSGHVFRSTGGAWATEHVGPDGTEYWDVSGTSDADVWVSGTHILHYDGATWTVAHGSPASGFIYTSIWTAGGTSVFAGTNSGAIRRYEGGVWVEAQSAPDNGFAVTDIWGTSANDVWVVDEGGFVRHWNGVAWEPSTRFAGALRAVWGTSATSVWVAGNNILAHWNGAIWFSLDPATTAIGEVRAGWQSSATSGWFVTAQGTLSELRPEGWTTHWDSPGIFMDIAGSASDVWICGHRGSIQHLTGGTWRTERLPRSDACGSVTARSTTDVLAGGVAFLSGTPSIYYRFNGSTWTVNPIGAAQRFDDMWTTPAGQSYAVDGTATVYRFDGAAWVAMPTGSPQRLHSIWASGPNDVFAAGEVGTVMHYDGASWTRLATGTTGSLQAAWGASSGNVFFVGSDPNGGLVLRYNGTSFSTSNPTSRGLRGVHGRSPNEVYAVGAGGTIIRFDGTAWSAEASGVNADLYDVWTLESGEVYVVGVPSLILRGVR